MLRRLDFAGMLYRNWRGFRNRYRKLGYGKDWRQSYNIPMRFCPNPLRIGCLQSMKLLNLK